MTVLEIDSCSREESCIDRNSEIGLTLTTVRDLADCFIGSFSTHLGIAKHAYTAVGLRSDWMSFITVTVSRIAGLASRFPHTNQVTCRNVDVFRNTRHYPKISPRLTMRGTRPNDPRKILYIRLPNW